MPSTGSPHDGAAMAGRMRRLYRNRMLKPRAWLALGLVVGAMLLTSRMLRLEVWPDAGPAIVALVRIMTLAPLAVAVLGAALLLRGVWRGVGAFDVNLDAGRFRLKLWRPLGWRQVEGRLDDISGWNYRASRGLGGLQRAFRARLADPSLPLHFEIRGHRQLDPHWRRIAPGAVAAYERETGLRL